MTLFSHHICCTPCSLAATRFFENDPSILQATAAYKLGIDVERALHMPVADECSKAPCQHPYNELQRTSAQGNCLQRATHTHTFLLVSGALKSPELFRLPKRDGELLNPDPSHPLDFPEFQGLLSGQPAAPTGPQRATVGGGGGRRERSLWPLNRHPPCSFQQDKSFAHRFSDTSMINCSPMNSSFVFCSLELAKS